MQENELIMAHYYCGLCKHNTHVLARQLDSMSLPNTIDKEHGCSVHGSTLLGMQKADRSGQSIDLVLARITPTLLTLLAQSKLVDVQYTPKDVDKINTLYDAYRRKGIRTLLVPMQIFITHLQQAKENTCLLEKSSQ